MTTFEKLYPNTERVYLLVSAVSHQAFGEALDQIVNALRKVRKVKFNEPNNFAFETQELFKDQIKDITMNVQLGATAVASIGLLVGVIGVMNIMLAIVTERIQEIGLRRAVGARKIDILL